MEQLTTQNLLSEEALKGLKPLESAVEYLASFSERFNWVGVYILVGDVLVLSTYKGAATEHTHIRVGDGVCGTAVALGVDQNVPNVHDRANYLACSVETKSELVVLIRNTAGNIVGQIDIDSHVMNAFGEREEKEVQKLAKILGQNWDAILKTVS